MALDLSHKKLLVVDDFPEMRSMVRKMAVAFRGNDIDDAKNGVEAVKMLEKKKYDIVLCDYNLGEGKDGQQVLEEAKHRELINYATVFMLITAENTVEMVMGAMEYHPDGYLSKPFTKTEFAARLEKILEKKADLAAIEKAISRKDNIGAIALCNEKIAANPKNAFELLKIKAELCEKTGDFAEAGSIYEKVLSGRDVPWAALGLARVRYHTKDYMAAREMLQDLIEKNNSFVEAYDWLAKTYEALGDLTQAQRILVDAVQISPKAILRQKALADVAYKNKDLDMAETAFKRVIRIGKSSCFKKADDYAGLSKVYLDKKSPNDALKVISSVRDDFDNAPEANLQAAVVEGRIYKDLGQTEMAEKSIAEATHIFSNLAGNVSTEVAMDLAKTCFALGKKEQGENLVKYVVRNHHEDESVLKQAQALFTELGMGDEGKALIASTRQEVIDVNNQGVQLAKEGKLEESIEFFAKAASGMPDNQTINLNAAQSLIMHMQKNGKNDKYLYQTRQYLDRIRLMDPTNEKYQKLLAIYKKIVSGGGAAVAG